MAAARGRGRRGEGRNRKARRASTGGAQLAILLGGGGRFGASGLAAGGVDRVAPAAVLGPPAPHDVEVEPAQIPGDRTDRSGPDRAVIDPRDRGDLDSRAGKEGLLGQIDVPSV